ncbi:MAG: NRDE family protein [Halobacteria archaeon]|nr:NRDE family protein [Halobacteria archaeon]
MCTIILANGVFESRDGDVVIAANRDEEYGRGFQPPVREETQDGWIVAPRDTREGGTWMGVNSHGLAVGLSNIYKSGEDGPYEINADAETRSRGLLCDDVLHEKTLKDARRLIDESVADNHNHYSGFNLLVASPEGAFVAVHDDADSLRFADLKRGLHVLTNSPADEPDDKSRAVLEAVPPTDDGIETWIDDVKPLLADHYLEVCRHDEENARGTTSSSILTVGSDPIYYFANGAPCETEYERMT